MNLAQIAGYSFVGMGALIILSNYYALLEAMLRKGSTSFVLILGGGLALAGILISNIPSYLFWIPILADFTIPMVVYVQFFAKGKPPGA